jgi:ATP-dependent Clp protease ATP-binding subunit ClpC
MAPEPASAPLTDPPEAAGSQGASNATTSAPWQLDPDQFPILTTLGRNLSELAARGRLDPVIERDRELEQLLDVLARRRANNPLLVGAPGVGKTAVVEGLALHLAREAADDTSEEGRIVVELSAGRLVSGTGVRGALADRMQKLRDEVSRSEGRVLLFIDEIHAIVGGDGPDDLAQELKASLARGELPCIGATTEAEYRRCFEKDSALARRFSVIRIEEPTEAVTVQILQGILGRYERHHGVTYAPDAIEAAVALSDRYMRERQLPDKAIGLLDQAAARVRRRGGDRVELDAVASVVAESTGVPLERLMDDDATRLLELEQRLAGRIVGHEHAIERVAEVLRQGAAGFRGRRPLGTFLLLGPTGVGKTEMAKAVADVMFPAGALVRFDMSELSEPHSVARLLGAPPGYIGHEEGGQLTEAVRRRPYQLVLLDEIDKAHPDVLLALLPLLDEGRLTDARGRTVDFTHTIVFMTSNLGAEASAGPARIGFGGEGSDGGGRAERALASARSALPPELWNRIDEPLHFGPLDRDDALEITRRLLDRFGETLERERHMTLRVERSALEVVLDAGGYDPTLGARPLRRTLTRLVEAPIATAILARDLAPGDEIVLRGEADRVVIDRVGVAAAE